MAGLRTPCGSCSAAFSAGTNTSQVGVLLADPRRPLPALARCRRGRPPAAAAAPPLPPWLRSPKTCPPASPSAAEPLRAEGFSLAGNGGKL